MVAYSRQILSVLLTLLQLVAPLVHAHVGSDLSIPGLHLHELEYMQAVESTDMVSLGAVDDGERHCNVVNIDSAIKQAQVSNQVFNGEWTIIASVRSTVLSKPQPVIFTAVLSPPALIAPILCLHACRAPPSS